MTYRELKRLFYEHEDKNSKTHLTAYITFSRFSPEDQNHYSWESRTYAISSGNKAFQANMGGYSIFGSCLDGSDRCLRLDYHMRDERGGKDGWIIEDCCIVGYMPAAGTDGRLLPKLFYTCDEARTASTLDGGAECVQRVLFYDPLKILFDRRAA